MRRLLYIASLVRPHNVLAAVLCVATGYRMAAGGGLPGAVLLVSVGLVTAAGNMINDYYDVDIDSINKPRRVLPSGRLSPRTALTSYLAALLVLVALFWALPPSRSAWLAAWVVALHLYSRYLKRMLLAGNLAVGAVTASGFLLGAMAGGKISAGILPSVLTFFFVTGREIIKDCEDFEGDLACGARTLPVAAGRDRAARAAAVIFLLLAAGFPVPWLFSGYSSVYGLIILTTMLPVLLVSFILSLKARRFRFVTMLLKAGMFLGIAAFLSA